MDERPRWRAEEGREGQEYMVLEIELKLHKKLATINAAQKTETIENVLMLHSSRDMLT